MKMDSLNSKPSKKLMKRLPLTSFKKALASSIAKAKAKRGGKGFQAKAEQRSKGPKEKPIRGTIYISHLPHGFYEEQIKEYFTQFGIVTGVSLPRSKRTGRTRGHAFVQFLHQEVAGVAVQTMNKYLMSNRIIEACLLTPRECRNIVFNSKNKPPITPETCASAKNRKKFISERNSMHSKLQHEQMVIKEQGKLKKTQLKLTELGLPEVEL